MNHGFHGRACDTLNAIAVRCAVGGAPLTAARLFGAAQATRASLRSTPGIYDAYWTQQQVALRRVLGDATFDEAYGEGAEFGLDEAVALALGVEHPDLAADSARFARRAGAGVPRQSAATADRHSEHA